MDFLCPLVDLKDWGLKKPDPKDPMAEWEPKPHLPPGMLPRWINRGPVPDKFRIELSAEIIKKHLAKENAYYYRASPTNKSVLLCVDLDSHEGQIDCDELAKFIQEQYFPKAYFEASTRGYHGYFVLDLVDFPRRNLKPILASLTEVMEARRIAEGFESDVDRIKGTFNTPHWINGRWEFLKGDRGVFAKLPTLPDGFSSLNALKDTAIFKVDDLQILIERDKHYLSSAKITKHGKPPTTCHDDTCHPKAALGDLSCSYRSHVDGGYKGSVSLEERSTPKESTNTSSINQDSLSSPPIPHPRSICLPSSSILEGILKDSQLCKIYTRAKEQYQADPLKRMHTAFTLAWYTDRSYLATPEALSEFYRLLELKGTAPLDDTTERAEAVLKFRQSATFGMRTFVAEKWLPLIQKYVGESIRNSPLAWPKSHIDRGIPDDSLAAVLWIATKSVLQEPLKPHYRFSLSGDQLRGYLNSLCNTEIPSISSPLGNNVKRTAALRMLQLANLVVLRKSYTTGGSEGRSVGNRYGLGVTHPQHSQYVSLCESLGEDPFQVNPKCLSLRSTH